eukprot:15457199-Alexandrium_andersonii.AAC.1
MAPEALLGGKSAEECRIVPLCAVGGLLLVVGFPPILGLRSGGAVRGPQEPGPRTRDRGRGGRP